MPGTLFVVATPIGNLEDITVRALRVLREVAVIAAEDTRRTAQLLARHGIKTPTTSLHEHNEARKSRAILARLEHGEHVALVSDAGTPTIADPGADLVRQARAAGYRVEPIPGPSAVMAALAVSGLAADAFTFLGFPPSRSKARKDWFAALRQATGTVVFFEAPHRIRQTLADLQASVGDVSVSLGRELTKVHEQLVEGPISAVLAALGEPRGEYTVVTSIGQLIENEPAFPDDSTESRRQALANVARSYGISANELYEAITRTRNSGNRPS
jgi:16S rRNA (cytidine1402-2'-O)-methyltransferase